MIETTGNKTNTVLEKDNSHKKTKSLWNGKSVTMYSVLAAGIIGPIALIYAMKRHSSYIQFLKNTQKKVEAYVEDMMKKVIILAQIEDRMRKAPPANSKLRTLFGYVMDSTYVCTNLLEKKSSYISSCEKRLREEKQVFENIILFTDEIVNKNFSSRSFWPAKPSAALRYILFMRNDPIGNLTVSDVLKSEPPPVSFIESCLHFFRLRATPTKSPHEELIKDLKVIHPISKDLVDFLKTSTF